MTDQSASAIAQFGPSLLRAGRAALGWGLLETGSRADVSVASVLAAERGGPRTIPDHTWNSLRQAYEEAGVRFHADDVGGCGIHLLAR